MNQVLINFAHPARAHSNMNNAMRDAVSDLEGVVVNDLYAEYPDFFIDVKREQALCEASDVIIFQHPFYWYSTPAIVKEWMDLVLEHCWAYGTTGQALSGKVFMQALTAGGDEETYQKEGLNKFTIKELTSPMQATANLCHMRWIPPFAVLGIHRGLAQESIVAHAEEYRRLIIALRDQRVDLEALNQSDFSNSDLNQVIR